MTGQPFLGFLPFGSATEPETAIALPSVPVERYSSSRCDFADFSFAVPVSFRAQIASPCLEPGSFDGGV